jgi:hypothetical protein
MVKLGELLDVGEVEEVLAEIVLPESVGRPVEMGGERGENPRSCMSSSMRWRSGVMASPFRAAGTARHRMRRDVTHGARGGNDREHSLGYPPKAD